jgi:septal ring factor EnvC (AmiA/AmiB activator)
MDKINLLFSKKQYLTEFYDLVIKEKECLVNEEWGKVENIIRSKQLKMTRVDRINGKLKRFIHTGNKEEGKVEEEIIEIVRGIKELEDNNIEMLKENIRESKKDFKEIKVKQKVNTAYLSAENIQKDGCFIDKFK